MGAPVRAALLLACLCVAAAADPSDYAVINGLMKGWSFTVPDYDVHYLLVHYNFTKITFQDMSVSSLVFTQHLDNDRQGSISVDVLANVRITSRVYVDGIPSNDYADVRDMSITGDIALSNPTQSFKEGDAVQAETKDLKIKVGAKTKCSIAWILCGELLDTVFAFLKKKLDKGVNTLLTHELQWLNGNTTEFNNALQTPLEGAVQQEERFTQYSNDPQILRFSDESSALSKAVGLVDEVYGTKNPATNNTLLGEMLQYRLHSLNINKSFQFKNNNKVTIQTVNVTKIGLPVFSISAVGNYSFEIAASLRDTELDLTLGLDLQNPDGSYTYKNISTAKLTNFAMDFSLSMMMVMNTTMYGELPLNSILPLPKEATMDAITTWITDGLFDGTSILQCWLNQPLLGINISTSNVTVLDFDADIDFISDGLSDDVNVLLKSAKTFVPNGLRYLLNHAVLKEIVALDDGPLASVGQGPGDNPINKCATTPYPENNMTAKPSQQQNFSDNTMLKLMDFAVNNLIGSDGPWGIDAFLNLGIQKVLPLIHDTILLHIPVHLGYLKLEVGNAKVLGTSSITEMDVLIPKSPYNLSSSLNMRRFNVSIDVALSLWGENQVPFSDSLRVYFGFDVLNVEDLLTLVIDPSRFLMSPISQLTQGDCAESTLLTIGFPDTELKMTNFVFVIDCLKCDSPGLYELAQTMTSPVGQQQLQLAMNAALGQANHILNQPVTTDAINRSLSHAVAECDHTATEAPATPKEADDTWMTVEKAYIFIFGCAGLLAVVLTVYSMRSHTQWCKEMIARGDTPMAKSVHMPLIWHPSMSSTFRYTVLVVLLGTIGMFLSSNIPPIGTGATVHAHVLFGGSMIQVNEIFKYALGNTVSDMWNAEVYALSLLVCFLSGVWPYCKMVGLVWCWVCPPSALSHRTRERILCVLDFFGKWSLIDSFMVMMMMCAFRLHINLPPSWQFVPDGIIEFDILVTPHWGLFGFMTAAILSLTVNHLMVIMHRESVLWDETDGGCKGWFDDLSNASDTDEKKRVVLATHVMPGDSENAPRRRAAVSISLMVLALTLLITGVSVDTFEFTMEGLAGLGRDLDRANSSTTGYSMISLAKNVLDQATSPYESFEYTYLVVVYMLFTVVVPLIQIVSLLMLWVLPLTLREQKMMYVAAEVIAAWSALDVFVVVLIATLMEIGQFVRFLIGHGCDQINDVFANVVHPLGYLTDVQPTCFNVESKLVEGTWILFAASIAANLAYFVAHRSAATLIQARQEHMEEIMPMLREAKAREGLRQQEDRSSTQELSDDEEERLGEHRPLIGTPTHVQES